MLLLHAEKLIRNYRHFTTRQLVTEVPACKASVSNNVDIFGYSKSRAPWISRSLTDYYTMVHREICSDLFFQYEAESESFS